MHLALVSLLRTARCQLPSASLLYISQFHLSCASLTCTSQLHLSHLNLWMLPLTRTSQFHLWYATFTSALSLQLSIAVFISLMRTSGVHSSLPPRSCTWRFCVLFATLKFTSHGQLSFIALSSPLALEPHVQLPCVPRSFTSRLNLSLVPFALTCQWHRSCSPPI